MRLRYVSDPEVLERWLMCIVYGEAGRCEGGIVVRVDGILDLIVRHLGCRWVVTVLKKNQ
jgi:hypothetical protein